MSGTGNGAGSGVGGVSVAVGDAGPGGCASMGWVGMPVAADTAGVLTGTDVSTEACVGTTWDSEHAIAANSAIRLTKTARVLEDG